MEKCSDTFTLWEQPNEHYNSVNMDNINNSKIKNLEGMHYYFEAWFEV